MLGNENLTLRRILAILEGITGLPAPRVRLPYTPILIAAYINEAISRCTGKRAAASPWPECRWRRNSCSSMQRRRCVNWGCGKVGH